MIKNLFLSIGSVAVLVFPSHAQRVTESFDYWVLGINKPVINDGYRGDGTTGSYFHILVRYKSDVLRIRRHTLRSRHRGRQRLFLDI